MIKKLFTSLFLVIVIGVVVIYFFGSKLLNKSIQIGVETIGPTVTKTPVTLEEVKLSILSGDGKLSGLYVGNPEGFSSENIFALSQVEVDTVPRSLFSDEIVINKIYIKEPHIRYEKTQKTSNLKELLKNIEGSPDSSETTEVEEPPADEPTEEASGKTILIKEFFIEKPNVFLSVIGLGTTVTLPDIELTNINSSQEEIAATILKQIVAKLSESIQSGATNVTDSLNNAAGDLLNSIKVEPDQSIKQVNEGIKNLLGK